MRNLDASNLQQRTLAKNEGIGIRSKFVEVHNFGPVRMKTYAIYELQSAADDKEVYKKVRAAGKVMTEISTNGAPKMSPKTKKLPSQRSAGVASMMMTDKITKQSSQAV